LFDIAPTDDAQEAAADLERWERAGIRMVSVLDREYPSNLRMIHQRPPVLFLRGTADERDAMSVAVVGTRQATSQGLDQAKDLAAGLAARGVPVISGLAAGIDTAAHTTALAAGGRMRSLLQHDWARGYAERPGVTVVDNAEHVFDGLQRLAAESAEPAELVWA
jgi:DNA processing protein